ncbi:MAG TPA: hypothetical protein VFW65_27970 [Pseudonocardiaceae bacterium]|nr:hypothetical protein [Pseudonocardiaceae bacterium]
MTAIDGTDWTALTHAYGSAEDAPQILLALLSEDPDRCGDALGYLSSAVLHQGSLYPATAPSALFVAGILDDPRTMITCASALPWDDRERPLRAALLEWLGEVAESASYWDDDEGDPSEAAAAARCQAIRRDLHGAVAPHLDDPDESVRAAATSAMGHLLSAPDLAAFRDEFAQRLLRARDTSAAQRATAALILNRWGEAPRTLLVDPDPAVRAVAALAPSLDADPAALAEIRAALADPARADAWFPSGAVPRLGGKLRFALVRALLRRTGDFDDVLAEAVAVAGMTTAYTVDSDWGPLLERAFPQPCREPLTSAQRRFLAAIVDNDRCWDGVANPMLWFNRVGLPYDRDALRVLIE